MITFDFHSPEEEIFDSLFQEKRIRVYIKRDDLIHPFISGNKWRKLKYILRKAEAEQKKHLVTFGGVWSNHLLATACAAAKFGFKSTGIIRGEGVDSEILILCRIFGMNLLFVDREAYRDKLRLFNTYFQNDNSAFFIDEGGYSKEATIGCSELVDEFQQSYHHIFCASGTGATAAGIINGLVTNQLSATFNAIPILKGEFILDEINNLLLKSYDYKFHNQFHFGGYAKTNPELITFIKYFSSGTGVLLDPVYTGKMMFAIFELAKQNYFIPGSKVLAIHTGGLFGLLGMKARFK